MQEKILHLYLCDRHCIQSTHFISSCIPMHSNDKTVLKVQIRFQILDECGSVPMQSGSQQWHGLSTTARKEHATYLQSKTGDCLTDLGQQCQDGHRIKCAREALTAKHMVHHSDRLTLNHTQLSAETAPFNPFSAGTNLEHALTLGERKKTPKLWRKYEIFNFFSRGLQCFYWHIFYSGIQTKYCQCKSVIYSTNG